MAHIERGEERATDLGVDLLRLELGIGPHADRAADIVDEDVDAPEQLERAGHRGGRPGMGLQIGDEGLTSRLKGHLLDEIGPVDEEHLAPFGNGALGHSLADALRRAGHDDRLAGEAVLEDHAGTASLAANFS
jgi:hypothetical protein